jgi:hypothetical protein
LENLCIDFFKYRNQEDLEGLISRNENVFNELSFIVNLTKLKNLKIANAPHLLTDLSPLLTLCENGNLEWVSVENNFIDLRKGTPNREVIDRLIEAGVEVLYEKGNRTEKTAHLYE